MLNIKKYKEKIYNEYVLDQNGGIVDELAVLLSERDLDFMESEANTDQEKIDFFFNLLLHFDSNWIENRLYELGEIDGYKSAIEDLIKKIENENFDREELLELLNDTNNSI